MRAARSAVAATILTVAAGAQDAPAAPREWWAAGVTVRTLGDVDELVVTGGARYVPPGLGLDVRADRAVLVLDRPETIRFARTLGEGGLPRREPELPASRRSVDAAALRDRLLDFLGSLRGAGVRPPPPDLQIELFRSIHLEGDVAVIRNGVEALRADELTWSLADDRLVARNVVLRLVDDTQQRPLIVTLRAPELVRQSGRFVGRDVAVTTSRAGVPQFEVIAGEIEIVERGDEFEIRTRDSTLAVGSLRILPIPDQTWFTSDKESYLIRSASVGYSEREGAELRVVLGSSWNETGGSLHEALTGRAREEFRGDWQLGVGVVEKRGLPLRPELTYRGGDLYEGRAKAFLMDDTGRDIRDIRRNLDGTPIDADFRSLVRTENRVHLSEATTLDLTLFDASDPAALSEFDRGDYFLAERPETSVHLRHVEENVIGTLTGRWNLDDFAYGDDRGLTDRFVEEQPRLTLDWFSESIADLPGGAHLLLTSSTDAARFRANYDPRSPLAASGEETWRIDQRVELAAPFQLGPLHLRPFVEGRLTWYEETAPASGGSEDRYAFATGAELGTRIARTFRLPGDGELLRHVLSPTVRYVDRFAVDDAPSRFPQFDQVDALDESAWLRFGLLQRVLYQDGGTQNAGGESPRAREVAWLDLAQNVAVDPDRDNGGDTLGLFEFEAVLRGAPASLSGVPIELVVEGEQDWNAGELRTFNNFVQTRTGDVRWIAEYRRDRTSDGQIGLGSIVPVRQRWEVFGRMLYDLDRDEFANYTVRLTRNDLDWRLALIVGYDLITDNLSVRVDFRPTLGGLAEAQQRYQLGGADFAAVDHSAF
ncbi:MAG: hypothetical protein IPM29_31575 [Planctomycetes bacterium]|nr:hypothetical protein [Planctomycetota bacterium]